MMQTYYNLSAKQKKEIFSKYSRQLNCDFYYSTLGDIIDYRDAARMARKSINKKEEKSFKSLLRKIIMQ